MGLKTKKTTTRTHSIDGDQFENSHQFVGAIIEYCTHSNYDHRVREQNPHRICGECHILYWQMPKRYALADFSMMFFLFGNMWQTGQT